MSTINKPEKFVLSKVEQSGDETTVSWTNNGNEYSRKSKTPIHPDFKNIMNKMISYVTTYYDMPDDSDDYTSFKKCQISKYGDDKGQSVMIEGVYSHPEGKQNSSLKTPAIQTHNAVLGYEQELAILVSEMGEEACSYVFDGKTNQTTMDLQDKEEVEEPVAEEA